MQPYRTTMKANRSGYDYDIEINGNANEEIIRKYVQDHFIELDQNEIHANQLVFFKIRLFVAEFFLQ